MDEYTIRQAIDLIHARRYTDARKLLRPVLEVSPTNEAAWIWFASTFASPAEKMIVYKAGLAFCVDSEPLQRWIEKCKEEIEELKSKGEEPDTPTIQNELPQNARDLKKVEEPKLELPQPGTPFEWHEPLVGRRRKTSETGPLFSHETETEFTSEAQPSESQPVDWMESLRGTMDVSAEVGDTAEDFVEQKVKPDQLSPYPGEDLKPETASTGSISRKLTNLWGALTGGEEEAERKPAEQPEKQTLSKKISNIWEKWGEEPKSENPQRNVFESEYQAQSSPFTEPAESYETELNLHPEFFEHPQPEPEPVPYDEPVIVWGAQQIETPQVPAVSHWDIAAISTKAQEPAAQAQPFGDKQIEIGDEAAIQSTADPYHFPFQVAATVGVVLLIVVILIFVIESLQF